MKEERPQIRFSNWASLDEEEIYFEESLPIETPPPPPPPAAPIKK